MTIIGIDLGTTYSVAAVWEGEYSRIIPNPIGQELTPSVVGIDDNGDILIGLPARERLISHPLQTISEFKRYMGTKRQYKLGNTSFQPEDLSSLVIKALKADAEAFLGESVKEAIISVPAYFNDTQRKSTRAAGQLAGFEVKRLINEPTAAAIAYGLPKVNTAMTFLVLDLGGGTFDVSVLELFEGTMEVHASAGDAFLGGNDFTNFLLDSILEKVGLEKNELSPKERNKLWNSAEQCKVLLTQKEQNMEKLFFRDQLVEWSMHRKDFESLSSSLLDKMKSPIERALYDASIKPSSLDAVVLAGGATRMPMVRNLCAKILGRIPHSSIDPDKVVAHGTAVQAGMKSRDTMLKEVVVTDVCPFTLGVEVVDQRPEGKWMQGVFLPIIERNSTVPVSREEILTTVQDNQTKIECRIFQGESRIVYNNIKLGELNIKVPKDKAGKQMINVRFTYDINGILEVEVTVQATGHKKRLVILENPGTLTKKEVEEKLAKLSKLKMHPRDNLANRAVLARAERLYEESLGMIRETIAAAIAEFETAIASQDLRLIERSRIRTSALLDEIEAGRSLT